MTPDDLAQLLPRNGSLDSADFTWAGENATDQTICGSILHAMLVHGCLNPIVHIDEGSALLGGRFGAGLSIDSVKDALKMLFDDTVTRLAAPIVAPNFSFDFSRVTIIVSSNRSLADIGVDPAIVSRLVSYRFQSMTREVRLAAARPCLDTIRCASFDEGQTLRVADQARALIPDIVDRSIAEGYDGAREIIRAVKGAWTILAHAELVRPSGQYGDAPVNQAKIWACIEQQMPARVLAAAEAAQELEVGVMVVRQAE